MHCPKVARANWLPFVVYATQQRRLHRDVLPSLKGNTTALLSFSPHSSYQVIQTDEQSGQEHSHQSSNEGDYCYELFNV